MNTGKACFGNKEEFAVAVTFVPDPDQGQGATTEESVSWGSLEIWVRGHNLCAHIEDGQIMQPVNWYLLPFLEWLLHRPQQGVLLQELAALSVP